MPYKGAAWYTIYSTVIFLLLVTILTKTETSAFGQWRKIYQFDKPVTSVYFTLFDSLPIHGFVSTDGYEVYRTYDRGFTWTKSILVQSQVPPFGNSFSFTFKNNLEGWFCSIRDAIECVSKTTDGGVTWYALPNTDYNTAIYYVPSTNLLISPYFNPGNPNLSISVSLDGTNFTKSSLPGISLNPTIGIAFSDEYHGIMTTDHIYGKTLYTTNGGLNWEQSQMIGESFQPIAVKGSLTFYMIRETSAYDDEGSFFRSTDGGITWTKIYQYNGTNNPLAVTGTVQYGTDHALFFQTIQSNSEGIMMSLDSGYTFNSLCGPTNTLDTRFYVRDSFIYAGDKYGGLWLNTTGIGSNSKPIVSTDSLRLIQTNCSSTSNILTFTLFDSCNGRQADLLSTSVSGSSSFAITSGDNPRKIHPEDSITVSYKTSNSRDTGLLHLKFKLGWKEFDTVVSLIGSYEPPRTVFLPSVSDTSLTLESSLCYGKEQFVHYLLSDTCLGTQGELLSATVIGSTNFQITIGTDSVGVIYNGAGYDTATLTLKFRIYEYEYDTVITLYGIPSPSRDSVSFTPRFAEQDVTAGGVTNLVIEPSKAVLGKGLSEIEMSVSYNGDILERVAEATQIPGASIAGINETVANGITTTTLRITGSDLLLDPSQATANIRFRTYLSDTTITPVTVTTKLNPQDSNYERCTLSANTSDTNFALTLLCGDSLLSRHLGGKPILTIISVKPNPARDEVTVEFEQSENGDMTIEIYDMLGTSVHRVVTHSAKGQNTKTLHLADLPSGSYILTLRTPSGTSSKLFTKER